jgi:hypothetical protein
MEVGMFDVIAVSMTSVVLFLSLHFVLWQWLAPERKGVFFITGVAMSSYALTVSVAWILLGFSLQMHLWASGPLFMLLLMGYLHLYVGIERSVSMRILGELVLAEKNQLTLESLHDIYPHDYMIRHRVDLMVETNWLIEKDGKYISAPKGERLSHVAIFLKKCYGMEITG